MPSDTTRFIMILQNKKQVNNFVINAKLTLTDKCP